MASKAERDAAITKVAKQVASGSGFTRRAGENDPDELRADLMQELVPQMMERAEGLHWGSTLDRHYAMHELLLLVLEHPWVIVDAAGERLAERLEGTDPLTGEGEREETGNAVKPGDRWVVRMVCQGNSESVPYAVPPVHYAMEIEADGPWSLEPGEVLVREGELRDFQAKADMLQRRMHWPVTRPEMRALIKGDKCLGAAEKGLLEDARAKLRARLAREDG